jgi:hypothetical protein
MRLSELGTILKILKNSYAVRMALLHSQPFTPTKSISADKSLIVQINHQPDATIFQFIILTFIYSSTCFGRFAAHYQELNDCGSRSARLRPQHGCHHDTKAKPKAATAIIELLMMGGKTPETCCAVNKRQDNKLENFCIWLVMYLNCTMMHGVNKP